MNSRINHSHLTAKEREKISFPTNWLLRNDLIKGKVLDYGCGFGTDVMGLKKQGFDIIGYDKFYFNEYPTDKYDTILCHYVLNVLELTEQEQIIMEISQLLNKGGSAYITVRRDVKYEGYRIHKIHKKKTFQRNVKLPFETVFLNEFCEIYRFYRKVDKPVKSECIFCRPSARLKYICESTNTLAVFDAYPVSPGHALIVPKEHIADYFEIEKKLRNELWEMVWFVKKYLHKIYKPDGYNAGVNVSPAGGQTVFHAHIHLIPRYKDDVKDPTGGVRNVIPKKGNYRKF